MIGSLRETPSLGVSGLWASSGYRTITHLCLYMSLCLLLHIYKVVGPVERGPSPPAGRGSSWVMLRNMGWGCVSRPITQPIVAAQWDLGGGGGVLGHTALSLSPLSVCFWKALYSRHAHGGSWTDP